LGYGLEERRGFAKGGNPSQKEVRDTARGRWKKKTTRGIQKNVFVTKSKKKTKQKTRLHVEEDVPSQKIKIEKKPTDA